MDGHEAESQLDPRADATAVSEWPLSGRQLEASKFRFWPFATHFTKQAITFRRRLLVLMPPITPQRKQFPKQKRENKPEHEDPFYAAVWNIFHLISSLWIIGVHFFRARRL